jgi:RHS repeat-associated protein
MPAYSVNGGVSIAGVRTKSSLIDMNGDGLLDVVFKTHDMPYFLIQFNTGTGFSEPVKWMRPAMNQSGDGDSWEINGDRFEIDDYVGSIVNSIVNKIAELNGSKPSIDVGEIIANILNPDGFRKLVGIDFLNDVNIYGAGDVISYNGTVTFSVSVNFDLPWGPLGPTPLYIHVKPNGNFAYSFSSAQLEMRDINGDGLPDHIFKYDFEDFFRVKLNKAGQVGLLKEIRTPTGGTIALGYDIPMKTVENPNSSFILTSVTKNDGMDNDYTTGYTYDNGFYDRAERQFYGYGEVRILNADGSYVVNQYNNQDYYTKGLLHQTEVFDEEDRRYSLSVNTYQSVYVDSHIDDSGYVSLFPQLTEENTWQYDPYNPMQYIRTQMTYQYDGYGNIRNAVDKGDYSTSNDDIYITILYDEDEQPYIVANPKELHVRNSSGTTLRRRFGQFDTNGNLIRLEQEYADGENPVYIFKYDPFGNIEKTTDPSGYWVRYEYETTTNAFIWHIFDVFDLESFATYDYHFGASETETDVNGNILSKEYDDFGRIANVFTSYSDTIPAVHFTYNIDTFPGTAVTNNTVQYIDDANSTFGFDPNETLDTVIVIDGLGRVIQTKKEGEVLEEGHSTPTYGMNVTGTVIFDEMGRVWKQGQPVFEAGYDTGYYENVPLENPTLITYDILGRTLETVFPDEQHSTITNEYRVENGLYKTIVTDPNGKRKISYTDARENIIRIEQFNKGKTLATRYRYSLMNEITHVIDTEDNTTLITYDSLGRRTSINNPDSGLVEYGYDTAGNMIWKIDNNLRKQGRQIDYVYQYNRLTRVEFPESPPVAYHYGTSDTQYTQFNQAGRLWKIEDESGSKEFRYGALGQEEWVKQTIKSLTLGEAPIVFETVYGYDYLGRMRWVDYPDDEVLVYGYDQGGQLNSVQSEHRGETFNYIDHIYYDAFGQRKQIQYSNGVTTNYQYDATRRWLENISTTNSKRTFQNMTYEFDLVGNITGTHNMGTKDYGNGTVETSQVYQYDDLYQLTNATGNYHVTGASNVQISYNQEFRYDDIGNMTKKVSTRSVTPINDNPNHLNYDFTYLYNQNKPHQAYKIGDWNYEYDANGNVIRKSLGSGGGTGAVLSTNLDMTNPNQHDAQHPNDDWLSHDSNDDPPMTTTTTVANSNELPFNLEESETVPDEDKQVRYTWNESNRLMEAEVSGETTKFLYDGGGERTIKKDRFGETTYVNKFFQVQNRDTITKHIFVGSTRIVSKLSHMDDFGDLPFEQNNVYYYHGDHLGNTTYITDKNGNEWEHYEYAPYGETWVTDENVSQSFGYRFSSKELDESTGLYNYGKRYHDPEAGRWISCDPALSSYLPKTNRNNSDLIGQGGVYNPINLNPYCYTGNNPMSYTDPDGQILIPIIVGYLIYKAVTSSNNSPTQSNNQTSSTSSTTTTTTTTIQTTSANQTIKSVINRNDLVSGSSINKTYAQHPDNAKGVDLSHSDSNEKTAYSGTMFLKDDGDTQWGGFQSQVYFTGSDGERYIFGVMHETKDGKFGEFYEANLDSKKSWGGVKYGKVNVGDVIGYMGNTGNCTDAQGNPISAEDRANGKGTHAHYFMMKYDKATEKWLYIDPHIE